MTAFQIRTATSEDLDAVMGIEAAWPEAQRATRDKFALRLSRFPQGFFLAVVDGTPVGASTSTLATYDPSDLSGFQSWETCTNGGTLHPLGPIADYNALFIVSNGIMSQHRGTGIREGIIHAHLDLAARLGMPYTVTGAMMPGYDDHCRKHGDIPAREYAFKTENGRLIDSTLRKLASLGLHLPDERHVVENYYPSPPSRNYGALLVNRTSDGSKP